MRSGAVLPKACVLYVALVVGGLLAAVALPAEAAFPGENGRIFFESDRTTGEGVTNPEADYEIFAMNPDGTGLEQITENSLEDREPAVSADGGQVAFIRGDTFEGFDLYTMNASGTEQQKLVTVGKVGDPAWSPDGRWIAYTLYDDNDSGTYALQKIRPDGSGESSIIRLNEGGRGPTSPAWSPDGKKLAYAGYTQDGQDDIFTVNPNGSGKTNLTRDPGYDAAPNWSPDGKKIVFSKAAKREASHVYKMKADGSGKIRLTNSDADDYAPAFSPDGAEIVFARYLPVPNIRYRYNPEIYKMKADGAGEIRLTNDPNYDRSPDWQRLPAFP